MTKKSLVASLLKIKKNLSTAIILVNKVLSKT